MKNNKIILSLLLVFNIAFAADPLMFDNNSTPVDANGRLTQPSNQGDSLIGDDTIPDSNIDNGSALLYNLGDKTVFVDTDDSGNRIFKDSNGSVIDITQDQPGSNTAYNNVLTQYKSFVDRNDSNDSNTSILITQNAELNDLKERQITAAYKKSGSIRDKKTIYLEKHSIVGSGEGTTMTFNTDINNLTERQANGEELSPEEKNEINATKFYMANSEAMLKYDQKQAIIDDNTTRLSIAYADIDSIAAEYTSRLHSSVIKCQITRNLVPTYFCPMTGRSGLRFPATSTSLDLSKVDIDKEFEKCNDFCKSSLGDYPAIEENIVTSLDLNLSTLSEKELFPTYSTTDNLYTVDTNGILPLRYISMEFEIINPADSNMTDTEWNEYINRIEPTVKVSIFYDTKYVENNGTVSYVTNEAYKDMPIYLKGDVSKFKLNLGMVGENFKIFFKKPFFLRNNNASEFSSLGGKIIVKNISARYISKSLWYCSIKQTVLHADDCYDSANNSKLITSGTQNIYICRDIQHKIGPETNWGGFYTKETAEEACIVREQCVPTYGTSANSNLTVLYETSIKCVNSPENTACSDNLCKTLFQDENQTILNEYVINYNKKNTRDNIYTIKNGALTDNMRPKINFGGLTSTTEGEYDEIFRTEEKDAAYINMIRNNTYNRVRFRIGEESPAKVYYKFTGSMYRKSLSAILKPASFDYTDNNSTTVTPFNIYAVMIMDHFFEPKYGSWFINGNNIFISNTADTTSNGINNTVSNGTNLNLQETFDMYSGANYVYNEVDGVWEPPKIRFMDRTYLVKTGPDDDNWKTFRRIKNYKFENTFSEIYLDDQGDYRIRTIKEWISVPAYLEDKFEFYVSNTGNFLTYDKDTEIVPAFKTSIFPTSNDFFTYKLSDYLSHTYSSVPGGLIHDQEGINHNTSYRRLYNVPYSSSGNDSYIRNAYFYLLYSDHDLTYSELEEEIEGPDWDTNPKNAFDVKWGVYEIVNYFKFSNQISGDEELNNGIMLVKKGKPESLTLGVSWEPNVEDKGSKAYKFVFLYDDNRLTNGD